MLAAVLGGEGAPQSIRAHCSGCCDITQHTLKIHNTIRRSIYTCGGCSKDTLPCTQCSQSAEEMGMAKDTPMYSHNSCLVCDGTMAAWGVIEEGDPPDLAPAPSPEHVLGTPPVEPEPQSGSEFELGQGVPTGVRHLAITGAAVAAAAALAPVAPAAGAVLAVGAVTAAVTANYVNSSGEPQLRAPSTACCVFAEGTHKELGIE